MILQPTITKKLFKKLIEATIQQTDLVTREEFDIQLQVLAKTRRQCEQLEKKLDALENRGIPVL